MAEYRRSFRTLYRQNCSYDDDGRTKKDEREEEQDETDFNGT